MEISKVDFWDIEYGTNHDLVWYNAMWDAMYDIDEKFKSRLIASQQVYEIIEKWRCRPLTGEYVYVYVDCISLIRYWDGEIQNVSVLVAIGVNQDGYREILGAAEGMKEDRESWRSFFLWLKERGLKGVKLIVGDKNLGMPETIGEVFPEAKYQYCIVHFYRSVCSVVPRRKEREVAKMLKTIHAQKNREVARQKAVQVAGKLREMKLRAAAKKVDDSIEETLTFMDFPSRYWTGIRTNEVFELLNREIKQWTERIGGAFPDVDSALIFVYARLRYIAGSIWGIIRYMNMDNLLEPDDEQDDDMLIIKLPDTERLN